MLLTQEYPSAHRRRHGDRDVTSAPAANRIPAADDPASRTGQVKSDEVNRSGQGWVTEWVSEVLRPARHYDGSFRGRSLQAITCTGTMYWQSTAKKSNKQF